MGSNTLRVRNQNNPAERLGARENKPKDKKSIVKYVAAGYTPQGAAKKVGVPPTSMRTWLRRDEEFRIAVEEAKELHADIIEDEAIRRGVRGVKEPVFYKGRKVGHKKVYSDSLLQTLLKGARPEKYAVTQTQHTGANGGPIQIDARAYLISKLEAMTERLADEPSKK